MEIEEISVDQSNNATSSRENGCFAIDALSSTVFVKIIFYVVDDNGAPDNGSTSA